MRVFSLFRFFISSTNFTTRINLQLKQGHGLISRASNIIVCILVGKAGEMIDRGDNTYGGKYVVNPSGGLISKGHPLGATGKKENGVLYVLEIFG